MLRTLVALICCGALAFALAACSQTQTNPSNVPTASASPSQTLPADVNPPADVVQASAPEVELAAGGSSEALVRVKIAGGYHINGNPASKFQIATALEVAPGEGVTAGKALYPPAISKKFSFSEEPITVYEGEAVIKQPLRAEANAKKGKQALMGKLKVQPCDDNVCYPPRTLEVSLPVNIK